MSLDIVAGDSLTVESGTTQFADEVNIGGELNVAGTLTVDDATVSAAGVGQGVGTASADPRIEVSAGRVFPSLTVDAGTTTTIPSGETEEASDVTIDGELNISGSLTLSPGIGIGAGVGTAVADPRAEVAASGVGEGIGSARADPRAEVSAAGVGEGVGTAARVVVLPIRRRESSGLAYGQERDEYSVAYDETDEYALDDTDAPR